MPSRVVKSLLHPVGFLGALLGLGGFLASLVLLVTDLRAHDANPYRGILTYMIFPGVMFLGMGLYVLAFVLEGRRSRRFTAQSVPWKPALDLQNPRQRRLLLAMGTVGILFLVASIVGGIRAYEFTESVNFCGQSCHEPMNPQFVAYQDSPHAHVGCPECHVGPGVEHYAQAKISGMRQVYKVFTDTFDRPIIASREEIRPANETCEGCHWPEKFWGKQLDQRVRFGYDLQNTRRPIQILMKTGGGRAEDGRQQGIHWHMNLQNRVAFRALDEGLQQIPWVEVTRADGRKVAYRDPEAKAPAAEIEKLPAHNMDCLDCHNRPAHRFLTPDESVDLSLESGALDASLPFIKKIAVQSLSRSYTSVETATEGIRKEMVSFYTERFEGKVLERTESLEKAINEVQTLFQRHNFPGMKVNGFTHPDNVGHREFPGCFRCHSGRHKTDDGQVLDSRCDLCHTFVEETRGTSSLTEIPANASSLHPWRGKDHEKLPCWTCHSGTASPYAQCATCHQKAMDGHGMQFECSICHKPGGVAVANGACTPCHPVTASPMHAHKDHGDCLGCHKPHGWKVDLSQNCATCHAKIKPDHYPGQPCSPCHNFKGVEATMKGLPVHTTK